MHIVHAYIQRCRNPGGGGGAGGFMPPSIFSRSVNPMPTGGGQIIPTYYYCPLQIFSPSGITDIFLTLVKKLPSYILLTCTNRCIKLKQCACFFWPDVSRQIYHLWVPNSTYVIHSSSREGVDIKVCLQFYVKSCTIFSCEEKESPTKLQLSWLLQRSTKY